MRISPLFSFIPKKFRRQERQDFLQIDDLIQKPDYVKVRIAFVDELKEASLGKTSSLSYLSHTLPEKPLVKTGTVQGIVIGGTNYIVSTQEISAHGRRTILSMQTGELPILNHKDILISFLKKHIDPRAEAIGVNFGFPLEPLTGPFGEIDGKLARTSKEHTFEGLLNQPIGDILREVVQNDIPVAVANDTVCLTLAGDDTEDGSLIAGTGFNIGLKLNDGKKGIILNLEAGNFDKFELSESLKTLDATSKKPGTQLFEKIISGKYLAEVFNVKAEKIGLQIPKLKTSQELSALSNEIRDDHANILARGLLERSAFLVAAALAGIYTFSGRPKQLTIIGEGSLLWKGWHYTDNIEKQLKLLGVPRHAIRIKHVKNSSINGAIGLLCQ